MNSQAEPNYTRRYVISTYLVFWCAVALVGAAFFASGKNMLVFQSASAVASWTPTVVLLVMFKKLFPGTTVSDWLKKAFAPRIHVGLLAAATAVLVAVMAATVWLVALRTHHPVTSILNLSFPTIAAGVLFTLIQGATGEEAGWRGYLQGVMEKQAGGVIKGSLLVGLIWSFWHTPLWFVSGALGWNLVLYIVTFLLGNLSLAVIIGVCFHRCKNLAVPMWIHFVSNLTAVPYAGDPMAARPWLALFCVLAAAGFALWHQTTSKPAGNASPRPEFGSVAS